jgi:hypothetical protein
MTVIQGVGVMCACVVLVAPVAAAAAQDADSITRGALNVEMSVQISITHTVLDKDGNPALPTSVPTVFTVVRTRRSGTWQTVMTYRKHSGAPTRASSHPLDGARVEFDEDSGATRVYDSTGALNTLLSREAGDGIPGARGPEQWLEGLVATDESRFTRSRDLSEKYGKPVGRVGGLDRFLVHRDGTVEEILADPRSALLREINTVRDGVLESHIVFDYDRRADGAWIRRSMRAEQIVPGDAGHRTRMTVEFANLSTGGR